jgi:glycosyltransferase involved in cell wall biosynthesis
VFAAAVEELRGDGALVCYLTPIPKPNDPAGSVMDLERHRWLFRRTPLRFSFGRREAVGRQLFDSAVARRLPPPGPRWHFVAFAGEALLSFARARKLGYSRLVLESPTSHVQHVLRRHRAATSAHPVEGSWLTQSTLCRTLREYAAADEIVVLSTYARDSFEGEGISSSKLRVRSPLPAPRFAPPAQRVPHGGFRLIYVGRLHVTKGVCILLDALAQIPDPDLRLVLHGGTATRRMDRHLSKRCRADGRISITSGDPLPQLHGADVLVHPSYEDGFALAPVEALATGLRVIVTEDTGMKGQVTSGRNGLIVPAGDPSRLADAIRALRAAS